MFNHLKIVSFNIRHGKGIDGKVSLTRVAKILKEINAHIVGLQEVDKFIPRSLFQNQAQKLARQLRAVYSFAPNLRWFCLSGYGNAIISMFPIIKTHNTLLPGKLEQRGLQYCMIAVPGTGPLHFFNTHLGLSAEDRAVQVAAIIKKLANKHKPIILTGDFNTSIDSPELQPLLRQLKHSGANKTLLTYPSSRPAHSIDHIFTSDHWRVQDIFTVPSRASDHLPLVCKLKRTNFTHLLYHITGHNLSIK